MTSEFRVRRANWILDREHLGKVRAEVFIDEQGVPTDLEWDGLDETAVHLIAEDGTGQAIGTARLLPSGQIGRMAVLKAWRGRGVGTALLNRALAIADAEGYARVFLNAQISARAFYERQGFRPVGDVFEEADIPHVRMELGKEKTA